MRLREDHRMRAIGHIIRKLMAPMGRQAVHDDDVLVRLTHQVGVDLVGRKGLLAPGRLQARPPAPSKTPPSLLVIVSQT